jgi:hypothetical protein
MSPGPRPLLPRRRSYSVCLMASCTAACTKHKDEWHLVTSRCPPPPLQRWQYKGHRAGTPWHELTSPTASPDRLRPRRLQATQQPPRLFCGNSGPVCKSGSPLSQHAWHARSQAAKASQPVVRAMLAYLPLTAVPSTARCMLAHRPPKHRSPEHRPGAMLQPTAGATQRPARRRTCTMPLVGKSKAVQYLA